MLYGHPLSSIQHPVEDPGMKSSWIFVGICCVQGGKSEKFRESCHTSKIQQNHESAHNVTEGIRLPHNISVTRWAPEPIVLNGSYVTQK